MSDTIEKLNVTIAGRSFPIKVPAADVHIVQNIVADLNRQVNDYQHNYPSRDIRDYLSMLLLTYAVDLNKHHSGHASDGDLSDPGLNRLDELLDQYLQPS